MVNAMGFGALIWSTVVMHAQIDICRSVGQLLFGYRQCVPTATAEQFASEQIESAGICRAVVGIADLLNTVKEFLWNDGFMGVGYNDLSFLWDGDPLFRLTVNHFGF